MREKPQEILLASGSEIRKRLLAAAGLRFYAESPGVDESACAETDPDRRALELASAKARAVSTRRPGALVLGSDQVFSFAGRAFDKPETPEAVRRTLRMISGADHRFHCGVALVRDGEPVWSDVAHATVTIHELTDADVEDYVATGEGIGCAGGYRLEEGGVRLIRAIQGSHFTVLGLPMLELVAALRRLDLHHDLFRTTQRESS